MTNRFLNSLMAGLAAMLIGSAALPGPAATGGSISMSYTPTTT
jgi:hypothetical protein